MNASLDLALIGNCTVGALLDGMGRIVWGCYPRFDGDPVFCSLLNAEQDQGFFDIELIDFARAEQAYVENTAIVRTCLYDTRGGAVEILDFAPRFELFGRMFRPTMLVRRLRRLEGSPRVRVRLRPVCDNGRARPTTTWGSNHVRYVMPALALRLTTDVSITAILDETPFFLENTATLLLGPDETVHDSAAETGRRFLEETERYWQEWVRFLGIPFEWQEAVIRAAITLKLNAYDDTGAIIAAMTTSIPESANSGRNWDYRYCWLRDGYFVVNALNRLGATRTMERYLAYIVNVAAEAGAGPLQPVFGIDGRARIDERIAEGLAGYRGMGPVRIGNQAYAQVQHDVYGSAVLAATHIFFDQRLTRRGDVTLFRQLEALGERAAKSFDQPDAGLWELRNSSHVHTFSSVMCWAACDRLARIATRLDLADRAAHWQGAAKRIHAVISERAWNWKRSCFAATFEGATVDASLLLLAEVGFPGSGRPALCDHGCRHRDGSAA
jgi:GH15 family glucan-1,4-alpha-glucosidase